MRHYKDNKKNPLRRIIESSKPWNLKYRVAKFHYFNITRREFETVYWVQARLKWFPIWLTVDEWITFSSAYKEMKALRNVPKSEIHVYTEDECVLELMGEMEE